MSVIYAVLERLEAENPTPAAGQGGGVSAANHAVSPRLQPQPGGLPVKALATATVAMVVMAGAGLMLWQGGGEPAVAQQLAPAAAQHAADSEPESQHQARPIPEPAGAVLESVEPNNATATAGDTVAAVPAPVVVAQVTPGRQDEAAGPERQSAAAAVVAARSEPDSGSSAVKEPAAVPPRSGVKEQAASIESTQRAGVEEAIEEARLALSRGRYPEALSVLEALSPVPEDRAEFWLIKGSAHLGMGQLDLAGSAFASARSLAPDNAQIAVQQAILLQEQGDHAGALAILQSAATRHPGVPEIYLNRGYSEQALGAVREAERSFRMFMKMTEHRTLYRQQRELIGGWLAQASTVP